MAQHEQLLLRLFVQEQQTTDGFILIILNKKIFKNTSFWSGLNGFHFERNLICFVTTFAMLSCLDKNEGFTVVKLSANYEYLALVFASVFVFISINTKLDIRPRKSSFIFSLASTFLYYLKCICPHGTSFSSTHLKETTYQFDKKVVAGLSTFVECLRLCMSFASLVSYTTFRSELG